MHASSYVEMQGFAAGAHALLDWPEGEREIRVVDVGAMDFNGTYRPLFPPPTFEYLGADLSAGPNVDIVLPGQYEWPVECSENFDVAISGQCVEHVERPWLWIRAFAALLRPGGVACVIAPHTWPEHKFPIDCWRILPDGMDVLFKEGGLEVQEIRTTANDTVGIARRPK